ncbi:ComF family protein [Glaciimonas soli]|uniref:ComF family protein n=1 Tax=Glaciimonas soli TaxID=2590999 RepID=A0A843YQJ0_9BURK|nr:ComF family protein [Glaciimonas soli]MQR00247.1 ComF family protein [Glaciimonas soli]
MFSHIRYSAQQLISKLATSMPTCCALCAQIGSQVICRGCQQHYFLQRTSRCKQCANPLPIIESDDAGATTLCGDCLKQAQAFDATIVAVDYAAPVDHLVLALKFGSQLALAPVFASALRDALLQQSVQTGKIDNLPDVLTAVPLGPDRLIERGYNQALEIAKPLSLLLGVPLQHTLIKRIHDTQQQAKLHPEERHRNLRSAFVIPYPAVTQIRGRHIGVIDDVMTTGATLNEIAHTLKRFGASRVTNFVFARTLPK